MSAIKNKELVKQYFDLYNRGDYASAYALNSPECIMHAGSRDESVEENKKIDDLFFKAFPDIKATVNVMIAEGDKVALQVTWKGTHKGDFMGIPPTGKDVVMTNTDIFRIKDGKFIEGWATFDMFGLMQQLGVIKPMN
jgi:steroid delta-isomerase-like uncharacterized protein